MAGTEVVPLLSRQWGATEWFEVGLGAGHPEQYLKLNVLVLGHVDWREVELKGERPVERLVPVRSKHRTGNLEFTMSHQ